VTVLHRREDKTSQGGDIDINRARRDSLCFDLKMYETDYECRAIVHLSELLMYLRSHGSLRLMIRNSVTLSEIRMFMQFPRCSTLDYTHRFGSDCLWSLSGNAARSVGFELLQDKIYKLTYFSCNLILISRKRCPFSPTSEHEGRSQYARTHITIFASRSKLRGTYATGTSGSARLEWSAEVLLSSHVQVWFVNTGIEIFLTHAFPWYNGS
jgi:hypothetical protein